VHDDAHWHSEHPKQGIFFWHLYSIGLTRFVHHAGQVSGAGVEDGVGTGVGTGVGIGVGTGVGTSVGLAVGFGVGTGVGTGVVKAALPVHCCTLPVAVPTAPATVGGLS